MGAYLRTHIPCRSSIPGTSKCYLLRKRKLSPRSKISPPRAGVSTVCGDDQTDVAAACVVLTRAFMGTPEAVGFDDAMKYTRSFVGMTEQGLFLVGRLQPTDTTLLPPGQQSRLVATVALSLHPDTRETFQTLQPPNNSPYLSNMAVDQKLRRRGIAQAMMAAAEREARRAEQGLIYLHVRENDMPAMALYQRLGYQEVARDSLLQKFQVKGTPRILMRKALPW